VVAPPRNDSWNYASPSSSLPYSSQSTNKHDAALDASLQWNHNMNENGWTQRDNWDSSNNNGGSYDEQNLQNKNTENHHLAKTKMCRRILETGTCGFGDSCG
jgi:hypothetical protein